VPSSSSLHPRTNYRVGEAICDFAACLRVHAETRLGVRKSDVVIGKVELLPHIHKDVKKMEAVEEHTSINEGLTLDIAAYHNEKAELLTVGTVTQEQLVSQLKGGLLYIYPQS